MIVTDVNLLLNAYNRDFPGMRPPGNGGKT